MQGQWIRCQRLVAMPFLLTFCIVLFSDRVAADTNAISTSNDTELSLLGTPNFRTINLHLAAGGMFALWDDLAIEGLGEVGGQGTLGADLGVREFLALSVLCGANIYSKGERGALRDIFATAGIRLRFAVDRRGALVEEGGDALGNVWMDVHVGYHRYRAEHHGGINLGLGYAFALARDFNLGPYGRIQFTPWGDGLKYFAASIGLQVSLGGQ
ncbi:MAG: hypothetical protein QNJ97_22135 [Myxococcota bacterium]|nr:hypothetical protein [Myxococcota bacterium]